MKILAVDDDRERLHSLRSVIRDALPEAVILTVGSGGEGIELARAEDPDVILLDMPSPGTDAFEVCRRIKAEEELKDIPVVFLAAPETDTDSRIRALEAGADGFLARPPETVELIALFRAMVRMKAAARLPLVQREYLEALVADRTRGLQHHLGEARRFADEWQATFDSVKDVMWILDEEMRVVRSNRSAVAAFGCEREDILGKHCWEIVHGTREPIPECPVLRMRRSLQRETTDMQVGERWIEVTVDPIIDDGGRLIGAVHVVSDITERKLAQESLQESTERYRALFESMLNGFALHEIICDEAGMPVDYRFLEVNPAFERITGLLGADIVGKTGREVIPDIKPAWIERYGAVALTGEPAHFDDYNIDLDRHYEISAYGPRIGQFAAIIEDTTVSKRAEAAVALQARRSAVLFEMHAAAERMTETEFVQWGQEQAKDLTASEVAFIHFVTDDERTIELASWCADAVRLREPIVANDWGAYAGTHDLPTSRADLTRFICVPVIENGKVVMLASVDNKLGDYTDLDVETLQLVANGLWRVVLRRRAEAGLRRSEENYRRLAEQVPIIIYRAAGDDPSTTTYISPAVGMLGFAPAEWLAQPDIWIDSLHPEDRPRVLAALKALHQGKSFKEEYRLKDRAGNWRHFRDEAVLVANPQDGEPYIQGVMVDISDRKHAQARTRQALNLAVRRRRELEGLLEASRTVQEFTDFLSTARHILTSAKRLLDAEYGFVWLPSESIHDARPVFFDVEGVSCTSDVQMPAAALEALRDAYCHGKPMVANAIQQSSEPGDPSEDRARLDNILAVPLNLEGATVGLIGLGNSRNGFFEDDVALVAAFGDLGAVAYKNAREMDLRKKAEESLRLSERRYRELFENPFTGVAVYAAVGGADEFVLREFNQAAERLTDRDRAEVLGKALAEAFPGAIGMGMLEALRQVHATGLARHLPPGPYVSPDGSTRWYENHIHRLPSGEVVALFEDVTAQQQAEDELRESRERYALLFDTSNDAIFVHTMDGASPGKFVEVNEVACLRLGYRRDELLRMSPQDIDDSAMDDARQLGMDRLVAEGHAVFEIVQVSKTGLRLPVEMSSRLFRYKGQTLVLSIARDVTERKLAESARDALQAQFLQAQKMESVGRLAGGVAHDFNNMLSIILGYGESIFDDLHPGDPMKEQVRQVLEAANRSAELTRQLLAFSRKQTLRPEVLDLNDILRGLETMLGRLIGEHIELRLALSEETGRVLVDPGQMEQVIMNLAVNARDAMPLGGTLLLNTSTVDVSQAVADSQPGTTPGRYVLLSVTDTGAGMSETVLNRVFEPFFTTKEVGKGTGLGLSTVYGIVKQSGGNIWVHSEPGRGSTFEVYLPLTDVEEVAAKERPEEARGDARGEHILVVEDEEGLRRLMETVLPRLGYRVTTAANGGEGLLLIEENGLRPDLVITDVIMPNMSGRQFIDRLRKSRPDLKVLYMSGYTDDAIEQHGVLDPNTPFVQKPFSISDIAVKIREVLEGTHMSGPAR